ncbi:unnamed protein product [Choristocarpus tenellus]
MNPILHCRRRSTSFWLHFPHIELIFLIFAFEGAITAQASMLRSSCPRYFWIALLTMLAFPVLMVVMVLRTIYVRVLPGDLLIFRNSHDHGTAKAENGNSEGIGTKARSLIHSSTKYGCPSTRCKKLSSHLLLQLNNLFGYAMRILLAVAIFSWADHGRWENAQLSDEIKCREAEWFRIGFEPIFIDFNRTGSIYFALFLIKCFSVACVGALINDRVLQLSLFFSIHAIDFILLAHYQPFANR